METKSRPILITEELDTIKSINECLHPEHWNKAMYDAFMLGYNLGRMKGNVETEEIMKDNDEVKNGK